MGWRFKLGSKQGGRDLELEVGHIEVVEEVLRFHQLDLQVLVRLIVIGDQVVDCLKQRSQTLAVILLFQQELFL